MNLKVRPIYSRSEVQRYVLFLIGRVGSTYLVDLLNSHPNIHALSEVLEDLQAKGSEAQLTWVWTYFRPPLIGRYKAIGFNTKLEQICNPEEFARLMRELECKVIHLQRRNRVKGVVSYFVGKKLSEATGMWGLFKPENRPSAIHIDPNAFDEHLRERERLQQELDQYVESLGLPILSLAYEDLLAARDDVLQQVFAFLHVKPQPVKAATLKITSDSLRDALINYDEIRARYVGTGYESMFDEVLVPS